MTSVPGENSDLLVNGIKLHIQTEDWADYRQTVISRVYKNGTIIKTFKLAYQKINAFERIENRQRAVVKLHQYAIDSLLKTTI